MKALNKLYKYGGVVGAGTSLALLGAQKAAAIDFNVTNPFTDPLDNGGGAGAAGFNTTAGNVATSIINVVLTISAILAVLYLIYSGILYITAGGNAERTKMARQGIINAVIGIVIIFASFVIVRFALGLGRAVQNADQTAVHISIPVA